MIKIKTNKNFISSLNYCVYFETRKNVQIFDNQKNLDIFNIEIQNYLDKNDITIKEILVEDNGAALLINISAPPTLSPTEVIFNLKRFSSKALVKNVMKQLNGEHAIWTRQYFVANTIDEIKQLINLKDE